MLSLLGGLFGTHIPSLIKQWCLKGIDGVSLFITNGLGFKVSKYCHFLIKRIHHPTLYQLEMTYSPPPPLVSIISLPTELSPSTPPSILTSIYLSYYESLLDSYFQFSLSLIPIGFVGNFLSIDMLAMMVSPHN